MIRRTSSVRRNRHMLLRTASVFVTFSLAYVFLSPSTGPVDDKLAFHRRLLQQEDPEESLASDGATQMSGTTVSEETISSSSAEDSSSANSTAEDDPLFPPDRKSTRLNSVTSRSRMPSSA